MKANMFVDIAAQNAMAIYLQRYFSSYQPKTGYPVDYWVMFLFHDHKVLSHCYS